MSIVSDALKKVEGNSAVTPAGSDDSTPTTAPPLFSVWSVLLSTIMVLIAAVLLLATWYTNRSQVATPLPPVPAESVVAEMPPPPAAQPLKPEVPPAPVVLSSVPAFAAKAPAAVTGGASMPAEPVAAVAEVSVAEPPRAARRDDLELTGVVYTPQLRMAHINGKILSEGDEIAGYKVIRISRDSVRMSKGGKFFILKPQH
jgi:hypothetical protein